MPFSNAGATKPISLHISLAFCLLLSVFINGYAQKPELIAQVGHTLAPHWLKFGLQGRILISAGDDHLITVWDVEHRRLLLTTPFVSGGRAILHDNGGAFSFSLDGTFMAVHTALDTIKVWNLTTGQVTRTVITPARSPSSDYEELSLSADGRFLSRVFSDLKGDEQKTNNYALQVWDLSDGRDRIFPLGSFLLDARDRIFTLRSFRRAEAEFSPDGRLLMFSVAEGTDVSKGYVWDVAAGRELYQIIDRRRRIGGQPKYFSRDGQLLFVIDRGNLQVKEAATGTVLLSLPSQDASSERFEIVEASDDRKLLVAVVQTYRSRMNDTHTLKLWQISDGKQVRAIDISTSHFDASSLGVSPDFQFVVCRVGALEDTRLKAWNISTGSEQFASKIVPHSKFALSQDGRLLAVGHRKAIDLLSSLDGSKVQALSGHYLSIGSIDFSLDGKSRISYSGEYQDSTNNVSVLNLSAAGFEHSLPGEFVTRSLNGKRIVTREAIKPQPTPTKQQNQNEDQPYSVTIWNAETGQKVKTFEGDVVDRGDDARDERLVVKVRGGVVAVDLDSGRVIADLPVSGILSPNGQYLAHTIPEKSTTEIYAVATGKLLSSLQWTRYPENPDPNIDWATGFSPDSRYFAYSINSTVEKNVFEVRDVATSKLKQSLPVNSHQSADYHFNFAFSSDGTTLITGGGPPQVWDLTTGKERSVAGSLAPPSAVRYADLVKFSPQEKFLADISIGERSNICLWEVTHDNGLSLHAKAVYDGFAAAFSEDDRVLATVSDDQLVKFWDIASGKLMGSLVPFEKDNWLVIAPDGRFDGTPAAWNRIFWRFPGNLLDSAPIEIFFNEFYYPGLLADIYANKLPPLAMTIGQKDRRQPRLELSYPNIGSSEAESTDERTAQIKVSVVEAPADKSNPHNGSGAQDVRLFRNGSLVKVWRGDVLKGKSSITLEATIPIVAGENKLTAYAFNHDNVKSSDATLVVNGAESLKRHGTAYILSVGINRYRNPRYNLKYAVADARDFAAELKRQQELLKRYAQVEIISLQDAEATKAHIIEKLAQLATRVQPEDAVIVFFAGHGTAHGKQFYLIPHDLGYEGSREKLSAAGLQTILAHSISDRELEKLFEGIDAGQLLLVIDACNSGQALEAEEKRRGPMNSKGLAQLAYEKGMYVMTAAQSYQAAMEAAKFGHGYLTYALVEDGLKKGKADREQKDGTINLREWLNYATEQVPRMQEENMLDALRGRSRYVNFVGDGRGPRDTRSNVQRPRIFYRRELDSHPLVIAVLGATSPQ